MAPCWTMLHPTPPPALWHQQDKVAPRCWWSPVVQKVRRATSRSPLSKPNCRCSWGSYQWMMPVHTKSFLLSHLSFMINLLDEDALCKCHPDDLCWLYWLLHLPEKLEFGAGHGVTFKLTTFQSQVGKEGWMNPLLLLAFFFANTSI